MNGKNDKSSFVCANSISCIKNLSGAFETGAVSGEFMGTKVSVPDTLATLTEYKSVLGDSADKKILVDLSAQRLFAKQGDTTVYEFPVSTGKWWSTPTGAFDIWIKLKYTRMSGGSAALGTYYNLPNVPNVMYFYNEAIPKFRGFGIHGAYWHNNFGHPMSHGCVNMAIEDSAKLFAWANPQNRGNTTFSSNDNPGTQIIIYGQTPKE